MLNAQSVFDAGLDSANELSALYSYLTGSVASPFQYGDVLRSQIVYSVSALDKLMHDIIRIGMVESFNGTRPPTVKYLAEPISLAFHKELSGAVVPPQQTLFEQEITRKLRVLSYQEPGKICDGLSYIWPEKHKWQKIAADMGVDEDASKTRLKLIATRRNAIVHESDIDPVTGAKTAIQQSESDEISAFIRSCGHSIVKLVS